MHPEASKPWRDNIDAIAASMAYALRGYDGWASVTPRDIVIEDYSGGPGRKVFKLTNGAKPGAAAAALHIIRETADSATDSVFFDRQRAAHRVFESAGISPPRVAEDPGKEWFVETWAGNRLAESEVSVDLIEEIARLVARVHAIDPAWYEDIRSRHCLRLPALRNAPKGNHIWWYTSLPQQFADEVSEALLRVWINAGPEPATETGSRIVTLHGDVHRGNILRTEEGLRLIDMEAACVGYAIHDLSYSIGYLCETSTHKEAFLRVYLEERGLPASRGDVFALRLDVERCKMATNYFDSQSLWETISEHQDLDDLGTV